MYIILILPLVARCLETIDVCTLHMFAFFVVTVRGSVGSILAVLVLVCVNVNVMSSA